MLASYPSGGAGVTTGFGVPGVCCAGVAAGFSVAAAVVAGGVVAVPDSSVFPPHPVRKATESTAADSIAAMIL